MNHIYNSKKLIAIPSGGSEMEEYENIGFKLKIIRAFKYPISILPLYWGPISFCTKCLAVQFYYSRIKKKCLQYIKNNVQSLLSYQPVNRQLRTIHKVHLCQLENQSTIQQLLMLLFKCMNWVTCIHNQTLSPCIASYGWNIYFLSLFMLALYAVHPLSTIRLPRVQLSTHCTFSYTCSSNIVPHNQLFPSICLFYFVVLHEYCGGLLFIMPHILHLFCNLYISISRKHAWFTFFLLKILNVVVWLNILAYCACFQA